MERAKYNLDTHAALWLYQRKYKKFPTSLISIIEESDLYISPLIELELQYLYEIKRIEDAPHLIIDDLQIFLDLEILDTDFSRVIAEAKKITWTRDAFDRIIAATSVAENMPLITADRKILENFSGAVWDR